MCLDVEHILGCWGWGAVSLAHVVVDHCWGWLHPGSGLGVGGSCTWFQIHCSSWWRCQQTFAKIHSAQRRPLLTKKGPTLSIMKLRDGSLTALSPGVEEEQEECCSTAGLSHLRVSHAGVHNTVHNYRTIS